jgi:hypothetical protein
MVMKLNTGVPGAGKTYLMIREFTRLFCDYDKNTGLWELKPKHKNKILISNIEGLTLDFLDLETLMIERCRQLASVEYLKNPNVKNLEKQTAASVQDYYFEQFYNEKIRWFFDYKYQKRLRERYGGPVIYLIEECQRYFDSKELGRADWVRDVLFFFEKHRHIGFSIFCDTQHNSKIHKGIACLFETEVNAKPRTLSVMGEFRYNEYSGGVKTNQIPIVEKPDRRVFAAYKSMSEIESVKTKKPIARLFIFVLIMLFGCYFAYQHIFNHFGGKVEAAETKVDKAVNIDHSKIKKSSSPGVAADPGPENWKQLSFVVSETKGVLIVHPHNNAIVPLKEFELPVKRVGIQLFYKEPGY